MEDSSLQRMRGEHPCNERLELDIAMITAFWYGATQLYLGGLEAVNSQ
jgi:hypothetical protein